MCWYLGTFSGWTPPSEGGWPVLGACRGALQDPSSEFPLPCCCMNFAAHHCCKGLMLPAMLLPSYSPAGTSADCGSSWDSWTGISFIDSCARSIYRRPASRCTEADWLNQTMVNWLLMFRASLDLPVVAVLIAPLLRVWLMAHGQGLGVGSRVNRQQWTYC